MRQLSFATQGSESAHSRKETLSSGLRTTKGGIPETYVLGQCYPKPFNPSTTIQYGLPQTGDVSLGVFNTLGQQVAVLAQGRQEAGYHEVKFDGSKLASGTYFYRLQAGSYVETKKLLLLRSATVKDTEEQ